MFNTTATTETVTGLTTGSAYTFTVSAINSDGTGLPSGASNSITIGTPRRPDRRLWDPGPQHVLGDLLDGSGRQRRISGDRLHRHLESGRAHVYQHRDHQLSGERPDQQPALHLYGHCNQQCGDRAVLGGVRHRTP